MGVETSKMSTIHIVPTPGFTGPSLCGKDYPERVRATRRVLWRPPTKWWANLEPTCDACILLDWIDEGKDGDSSNV